MFYSSDQPPKMEFLKLPLFASRRSALPFLAALIIFLAFFQAGTAAAVEKVTLQLRWDHQFQFAGYYAALWQGYYRNAGLDVEIRSAITPDQKILKAVQEVASGRADFGIGAADILVARDHGHPLVLVATIFQKSAARFYAREKTGLDSPAALPRLRVARNVNDLIDVELQAMLRAEGIDPGRVTPYPHEPGMAHLLDGRVDVIPGYETSIPYYAWRAGVKVIGLSPSSYGINCYGDSLFTRRALAENRPEMISRFRAASLKGWRYALEHPREIADRITREFTRQDKIDDVRAFNRFQAEKLPGLILYPIVALGHTNPERWKKMHDLLRASGIVKGELDPAEFIYDPEEQERYRQDTVRKTILWVLAVLGLAAAVSLLWILKLSRMIRQRDQALRERKASEERYRALFEYNPIETVVVDQEGRITAFNLTKRASGGGQPAIGQIMYRDYAREHATDMYKELMTTIHTGVSRSFPNTRYHDKYLDIRIAPFSAGAMITSIDMTARRRAEDRLRQAIGAIIRTLSMIVETRDPYTAGHQQRVADLARRIASELKMPLERIEGLRMAAIVHDIGKISVPAEILSKPTSLTALEINFIRLHPQTGYEILKDMDFPWPIADMVRQHHERLDGSGYPQGLKGEEISLEARILMVADVVEAMSSHRPYRPALGLEVALAEIETNRGILYDVEAVKACLHLFREEGYRCE